MTISRVHNDLYQLLWYIIKISTSFIDQNTHFLFISSHFTE